MEVCRLKHPQIDLRIEVYYYSSRCSIEIKTMILKLISKYRRIRIAKIIWQHTQIGELTLPDFKASYKPMPTVLC